MEHLNINVLHIQNYHHYRNINCSHLRERRPQEANSDHNNKSSGDFGLYRQSRLLLLQQPAIQALKRMLLLHDSSNWCCHCELNRYNISHHNNYGKQRPLYN